MTSNKFLNTYLSTRAVSRPGLPKWLEERWAKGKHL